MRIRLIVFDEMWEKKNWPAQRISPKLTSWDFGWRLTWWNRETYLCIDRTKDWAKLDVLVFYNTVVASCSNRTIYGEKIMIKYQPCVKWNSLETSTLVDRRVVKSRTPLQGVLSELRNVYATLMVSGCQP